MHWDLDVLKAMDEMHFKGIMGVPNATGLWQVADMYNNCVLKNCWVRAKRLLLKQKRDDLKLDPADRRIPGGQHDKIVTTDFVILVRAVFWKAHGNREKNRETIKRSGLIPFTKALLRHPEVKKGGHGSRQSHAAATDAAIQEAGGSINATVIHAQLEPLRE